jgi:V/A-type H+-transporting ATPase subunit C
MSADYGYINARVRGMRSKLLGPTFYQAALDATDFRAFVATLSQTPYMRELEEAQSRAEGLAAVDQAIARNFYNSAHRLLSFSDGQPHELIEVLLLPFDLANLKAIARGKHAGKGLDEIRGSLFPAGGLKPSLLEEAAVATDMPSAAQVLALSRTELAGAFLKAARKYQNDNDLFAVELALDQAYYAATMDGLARAKAPTDLVRYFQRRIDATNLLTALKLRGRQTDSHTDDLFVPGGRDVNRALFDAVLNDLEGSALQTVAGGAFAGVASAAAAGDLAGAEAEVRKLLDAGAKRLSLDPLDIGVVVDFLRRKEEEAAQLRLLARGKFYGVPRDSLARELSHA